MMMLKQSAKAFRAQPLAGARRVGTVARVAETQEANPDNSPKVQDTLAALDSLLPVEPVKEQAPVATTTSQLSSSTTTTTTTTSSSNSSSNGWQSLTQNINRSASSPAGARKSQLNFESVMGFDGFAPEIINGRAAMLGFVAAMVNETHGDSLFSQVMSGGFLSAGQIILLVVLASFAPAVRQIPFDQVFGKDKKPASFGPFTPTAELINGRAAMLGLLTLMFLEGTSGQPFFL